MRVERVLVVQDRELRGQLQHLRLGAPLGGVQDIEPVEDRALVEILDVIDHVHDPSPAETTDTETRNIRLLHTREITVRKGLGAVDLRGHKLPGLRSNSAILS